MSIPTMLITLLSDETRYSLTSKSLSVQLSSEYYHFRSINVALRFPGLPLLSMNCGLFFQEGRCRWSRFKTPGEVSMSLGNHLDAEALQAASDGDASYQIHLSPDFRIAHARG